MLSSASMPCIFILSFGRHIQEMPNEFLFYTTRILNFFHEHSSCPFGDLDKHVRHRLLGRFFVSRVEFVCMYKCNGERTLASIKSFVRIFLTIYMISIIHNE